MPPTESTILTNFLLPPASLPTIISLQSFTSLFPRSQQSSPAIRTLYRDLQHQRAQLVDKVTANIEQEVRRGKAMERAVVRGRRQDERTAQDDEVDIERALFHQTQNLPHSIPHSLHSIIPALSSAVEDLEDEIARLDTEAEELVAEMQNTVGGLSDLRYGRLANTGLRAQVLEGLERVEEAAGGK
ncbi:hypothetical protein SS1G_14342 [Sclerotinia sclerotiorum 1980 UF-70]|uniref:Cnl2/NKP2 family protein n=2 Tax=Sclerotinia sclerotiorum (strain ATCC 18683 / 1980 / Ss-1) TaxID=665079 RepID=A7F9R1_SCLS1|nr:hypothetical protein SS1G_14342 [Sclerotinia sclerotiorum 1980 UF-70]APA16323.1 hypothetical protein sscle_16g110930 [Sclerotinia sclerotiorum 1980 UF-70]EDO00472.1 hypothetical protein SS1G_14342 [Sclerotinia sclerotiorum 1980 UF-70]